MEGRIGNHGNQKESKKGQQEETLIGQLQSKPRGRQKRPLSFWMREFQSFSAAAIESNSGMRFSVFGQRKRYPHQVQWNPGLGSNLPSAIFAATSSTHSRPSSILISLRSALTLVLPSRLWNTRRSALYPHFSRAASA